MRGVKTSVIRLAAVVIVLGLSQLVQAQQASIWTQLSPSGGPPAKRIIPATVFDPTTDRMIVFGGASQDYGYACNADLPCYNDVWVLANPDGVGGAPAWTQLAPSGVPPSARYGAGGAYDAGSNRLIIFGGGVVEFAATQHCNPFLNVGFLNDVWILTNANGTGGPPAWTPISPAGLPPAQRRTALVVYDAANNLLILFGGNTACSTLNDVWVLSNANGLGAGTPTWTQLTPSGTPPLPRGELGFGGAYDAANNRLIIFGGLGDLNNLNDTWVLSNANGLGGTPAWTQLSPAGGPPAPRFGHTVTYDAATNGLTVVGGAYLVGYTAYFTNDVWRLSNANGLGGTPGWIQRASSGGPFPRADHSAIYSPAARRATIFAGLNCDPCAGLNDTWVLSDVVPFAAFSAAVQITQLSSALHATGAFTPGAGGSIDPPAQAVTFQLGGFMTTIPAGSFTLQATTGAYTYSGVINGVPVDATIQPSLGGGYTFTVDAAGAPGLPAGNPVTVGLTIGDNTGNIQVTAIFN